MLMSSTVFKECYVTFILAHGYMLNGCVMAYSAFLIPQLKKEGFSLSFNEESWLGSVSDLVGAISTFFNILLMAKFGRKRNLQISFLFHFVGWCLMYFSQNVISICICLAITSSSCTNIIPIGSTYISETCHKKRRGVLLSVDFICITLGSALNNILDKFTSWRVSALVLVAVAFSGFCQTLLIPETKYWHLLKNNEKGARSSLLWFQPTLAKGQLDVEINTIRSTIECNTDAEGNRFLEFLKSCRQFKYLKPLIIGALLYILRAGCGRPIVVSYTVNFFQDLNTPYDSETISVWFSVVELFGCCVSLFFVYHFKRKTVVHAYSAAMLMGLGVAIAYEFLKLNNGSDRLPWVPVAGIFVYGMLVTSGFMSSVGIITSEIQYAYFRGQSISVLMFILYMTVFVYVKLFPFVEQSVPINYIMLYFMVDILLGNVIVFFFVPETSKKEFYESHKSDK